MFCDLQESPVYKHLELQQPPVVLGGAGQPDRAGLVLASILRRGYQKQRRYFRSCADFDHQLFFTLLSVLDFLS